MLQQWSSGLLEHRTPVEEEHFVPFTSTSCFILPAMYFLRVARIFQDTEVSKKEIERTGPGMISTCAENSGWHLGTQHSRSKHPRSYTNVNQLMSTLSWGNGRHSMSSPLYLLRKWLLPWLKCWMILWLVPLRCCPWYVRWWVLIYGCMFIMNLKFGMTRNMFHAFTMDSHRTGAPLST